MEDAAGVDDNTDIQKRNTAVSTNSSAQKSTHSRSISNMRDEQEDAGMAIDSFTQNKMKIDELINMTCNIRRNSFTSEKFQPRREVAEVDEMAGTTARTVSYST